MAGILTSRGNAISLTFPSKSIPLIQYRVVPIGNGSNTALNVAVCSK